MLLENMSYLEVEAYLAEKDTILIPVGSVEQHSPYGIIGTDFITAEAIAKEVGKKLDLLVAPTLPYGMSQHHMGFKGTITLSPETFTKVIKDITSSLLEHGFKRVIYINGHGGNINPAKNAFDQLKYENKDGIFTIISWFMLEDVLNLSKELFDDKEGHHATPSEVSITKYLRPKSFKDKPTKEKQVENKEFYWPLSKEEFKKFFPDGRIASAPWLSKEKYGKLILEEATRATMSEVRKILKMPLI
jgi:creatinine amidohydrolase